MYDRSVSVDAFFRCLPGLVGPLFVWPSRLARLQNRTRAASFRGVLPHPLSRSASLTIFLTESAVARGRR